MKKLISIGVALALLTMVVVPGAVAADEPDTYAKVPFAIIGSGIELVGEIVAAIPTLADMIPFDVTAVTEPVGEWTAVNLAWSVDMVAWGVHLLGAVYTLADDAFSIGYPAIGDILEEVACGLRTCFSSECQDVWTCT